MRMIITAAASAGINLITPFAAAQSAGPNCEAQIYRAFDFWLGEWEVFNPKGEKAGENIITAAEDGCLIIERWQGAGGGTGQSYNFYDPGIKQWRQIWVARGATIDYAGGLNEDGAMVLQGEIAYRGGKTAPFRGTWTQLNNGDVRQHFEQQDTETGGWSDWFVGVYKKKTGAD